MSTADSSRADAGGAPDPGRHASRRCWTKSQALELAEGYRTWGKWGADDELGAANRITPQTIARAAGLVRTGQAFSLAIPFDRLGPQHGRNTRRVNPQHVMLRSGSDILAAGPAGTGGMAATDDAVYMPLQAATQWDALCHVFYDGRTYNGRGPESVTSVGAQQNSITNFKDRAVGRGVLLDIPRLKGVDFLEPGEAIQDEDLERCAAAQGVEIEEADFVLIRTGHLERRRVEGSWGDYCAGASPGLGLSAAHFLCGRNVTAVASDTWGLEVIPYETGDEMRCPLHVVLLVNAGIYIGEIWDMEGLAESCAQDRVYEFFLSAAPLTITGSVGSPLNPIAIK
jgi:kynurenine formamidase